MTVTYFEECMVLAVREIAERLGQMVELSERSIKLTEEHAAMTQRMVESAEAAEQMARDAK